MRLVPHRLRSILGAESASGIKMRLKCLLSLLVCVGCVGRSLEIFEASGHQARLNFSAHDDFDSLAREFVRAHSITSPGFSNFDCIVNVVVKEMK